MPQFRHYKTLVGVKLAHDFKIPVAIEKQKQNEKNNKK